MKLKNYFRVFVAGLFIYLSFSYVTHRNRIDSLNNELSSNIETIKAYNCELDTVKGNNRALKLSVNQLNYFSDSLILKLNDVRKELGIKDNEIKSLKYIASTINKKDTIYYPDTIFNSNMDRIDTVISDDYSRLSLSLIYPNTIETDMSFYNECYIITHLKKETIRPPKKYWIQRLFQKKHKVLEVEVIEKNKYASQTNQRFIEIKE